MTDRAGTSRKVHAGFALAVVALGLASLVLLPSLWANLTNAVSTLGGLLTLYGVIFAIVETSRARSAATQARNAATSARNQVLAILNVKNLTDCQSCIRFALTDLDRDGWTSSAGLARIIELYAGEFHSEYTDTTSPQRRAVAALQSHSGAPPGPISGPATRRLKTTLTGMLADVSAAAGDKISEHD